MEGAPVAPVAVAYPGSPVGPGTVDGAPVAPVAVAYPGTPVGPILEGPVQPVWPVIPTPL